MTKLELSKACTIPQEKGPWQGSFYTGIPYKKNESDLSPLSK